MEREIWKDIKGFEGIYQISNLGNAKRLATTKKEGTGNYARQEHPIKARKQNKGYLLIDLYKNNTRKQLLVHRLVAEAFIPNPNNYPIINHKDEDCTNNKVENLEWCTQTYNMNYGTCAERIGLANSKPIVAIDKDGNRIVFKSSMDAYRKLNISTGNIYDCLYHRRNRVTTGGYRWEFVK